MLIEKVSILIFQLSCLLNLLIKNFTYVFIILDLQFKKDLDSKEEKLIKIGMKLKKLVPFKGEMPSENIVPPVVGDQADCTEANTCHIDEFIYDEKEVEDLVKSGKLKKHYCTDCNSRNIKVIFLM